VRWETFFTFGDATAYGEDEPSDDANAQSGCCPAPAAKTDPCCAASNCG
jgi:hypothetical protein